MNINNIYSVKFKIITQIILEMKQERCIGEKTCKRRNAWSSAKETASRL